MDYSDTKVDKALNLFGFYPTVEHLKQEFELSEQEYEELKRRATERYGEI